MSILVLGILCGACRHVDPAPIDPARHAAAIERRSLDSPSVVQALERHGQGLPADNRWSIDQLTVAAWVLRPEIRVAAAQLAAARAETGVLSQRPNPTGDATIERVTNADSGVKPWVLGAALGMTIETAGKRDIRRGRALAHERVLEAKLGESLWDARRAVRAAVFARLVAERTLGLDDDEVMLRREYLDWVETRLEYGTATGGERLSAAEALSQVEGRRGLDRAAVVAASSALASAVGIGSSARSDLMPSYPPIDGISEFPTDDLVAARTLALTNRLDTRAALAEYEVAEQDLRAAVADQYPDIRLAPGYLIDQADHKITLNAGIPTALFHGGAAAVDSAVAARTVAAARFDQTQTAALAQIDGALALYDATRDVVLAAEAAERQTAHALATAERRLAAGAADRGEVLAARIELLARRRDTLDARRTLLDAVGALEDGVQTPLYPASTLRAGVAEEFQP